MAQKIFSPKAVILVDAALSTTRVDFSLVNSLRTEIMKQILFSRKKTNGEYGKLCIQLSRLPKAKYGFNKYAKMDFFDFHIWMNSTLKAAGITPSPSRFVLDIFERKASKEQKKKWGEILGN